MNGQDLRIVFMGTPEFAVASLRRIVEEGYNVVAVVTTPDKPAGRGQKIHESDVKVAAKELGLPILQPEKLRDPEFVKAMEELKPDLGIVIAFLALRAFTLSLILRHAGIEVILLAIGSHTGALLRLSHWYLL